MTCKDCIYRAMCYKHEHYGYGYEYNEKPCEMFKNKADVVEVVRCKDCKHWNCVSRVTEHMGCDIFCGAYGRKYPTNPDDYCSYGERREVCRGK